MYRSRSSLSYDILHGIQFPSNLSVMFAYLSYFPPPPPVLPGPPPRRSWTCTSNSFPSFSCVLSNDRNPSSSRKYIPWVINNQATISTNRSHILIINPSSSTKSSSSFDYIINIIQNQRLLILILIILLSVIFILLLFIYFQRPRQRQIPSNNKNKKFYYHLIPHRQKHETIINNNEHNLVRLRKDSPTPHIIQMSKAGGKHTNNDNETEEAV